MRTYLALFRIRFINGLQYRAATIGSILSRFCWAMMEILLFAALFRAGGDMPMTFAQTVNYVWIQQTCLILFAVVFGDGEIYAAITEGAVAYDLVRPVGLYGRWFCQSAANRVAFTLINCLPALVLAFLVPAPYGMTLPQDWGRAAMFMASSAMALGVTVAFAMLMYVSLFYLLSQRGVRIITTAVTSFFSGGVIPLPFFPAPVLAVVKWLPFAAMQNMPLQIYSGSVAGREAWQGLVFQALWLAALVWLGRMAMRRALRRVVVQGG